MMTFKEKCFLESLPGGWGLPGGEDERKLGGQ